MLVGEAEDRRPSYTAPRHLMHLLGIMVDQDVDGEVRGTIEVGPHLLDDRGGPRLGAVAMLIDALGGLRSITASAPDWAFTADMTIHLADTGPASTLRADLHVRRRGRRTLVIEADLLADDARPAGAAVLTFAVVPRPAHLAGLDVRVEPGRRAMGPTDERLDRAWIDEIAPSRPSPGTVTLELRREVSNTVGALHGAIHASMVDEAATTLARDLLGGPAAVTDLHLAYLDLGTDGPLTAVATPIGTPRPTDDALAATVELHDVNGRCSSYSTVRVRRAGAVD